MDAFAPYIVFNSSPEFYEKEESGKKPNTVRSITDEAMRWHDLSLDNGVLYQKDKPITKIIIGKKDGFATFVRELTDVSLHDFRYIFSWSPDKIHICYKCSSESDLHPNDYGLICGTCRGDYS